MINLVNDIENNCKDKSVEGIIEFLNKRGDLSGKAEIHREIYLMYTTARKERFTHRESKRLVMELFKISTSTFQKIRRTYEK